MANSNHVRSGTSGPDRLENQMVLLDWMHGILGYESTKDMLRDIKDVKGGFGSDGLSYIYRRLQSRGNLIKVSPTDLANYDANIHEYMTRINGGREESITLQYFQYLAVLYTEIFLDYYFNHRDELLRSLNELVNQINANISSDERRHEPFAETDLKKIAFWMATGSGKTLIMHVNCLQFLKYNNETLDNILLITPNEGLSQQHLGELKASNITASHFAHHGNGSLGSGRDNEVKVIEITKLVAEKIREGERIAVDSLEGNKLILVDEGHKGSGGEAWRDVRDTLGEDGFTFEYSATFGQALAAARNDDLVAEYGKTILFDYSYRHFHADGYGKDFHIINLQGETTEDQTGTLLLANMLSFYEQHLIYAEHTEKMRVYNLEKPLWVFVGSNVNATYTENKHPRSDVLTVVRFLHRILADKKWAVKSINRLLGGKSGLKDDGGRDVFWDKFKYLRGSGIDAAGTYGDILLKVLHTTAGSGLHICNIRDGDGELGLKAGGSDDYFGLIYIGDENKFRKLVEANCPDIVIEKDVIFAGSLFSNIDNVNTTVEILVGAKKFIEGWNSWRVSTMGLLNIGKSEGSQIIQLFGRGVRLRGLNRSLKRSSALDDKPPKYMPYLETLGIFSLRAKYMEQFRKHLKMEGVPIHEAVEIPLPIRINQEFLKSDLVIPRVHNANFKEEKIMLDIDSSVKVVVNLSPRVIKISSGIDGITETTIAPSDGQPIPSDSLKLVNMSEIYVELLDSKERYGRHNMVVRPNMPERILRKAKYEIIVDDHVLRPRVFADVHLLQKAATSVVATYAKRFYDKRQEQWEQSNMSYQTLDKKDPNFQDYTITIPDNEKDLIQNVQEIARECDRIYRAKSDTLPNVHFEGHLYLPLLVAGDDRISTKPLGLNPGEHAFVKDLRDYCMDELDGALAGKELFLLRNLSRGKGIGFFQNSNFYPDFILWIKSNDAQRIVFVEPHGMLHDDAPEHNEKVQLYHTLRDLTKRLKQQSEMKEIALDCYIVSQTNYDSLAQRYGGQWDRQRFATKHILFPERNTKYDYISKIIQVD